MKKIYLITLIIIFFSQNNAFTDNFFIDLKNGNDLNNGHSQNQAWKNLGKINQTQFQPGDSIFFKSDGVWNGQLSPKGSGTSGKPIVISKYGAGQKPLLNGQGQLYTVRLENQEYWEVTNLEITNYNKNDSTSFKRGVWIGAENAGTIHHIRLLNLDIHLVNGNVARGDASASKDNGGIFFEISGDKIPTNFDDILIEGCHISDVGRTGISLKSSWDKRTLNKNTNWFPSTNVVIRNNTFERICGNGLIWRVSRKPLVEHNVFHKCGLNLSGNAMFFFNCDSAIGQYNEAYLTVYEPGETDASGFDADYRCKNTVFQYNYSHDNGMGAFVICTNGGSATAFQTGATYRYNISQNENREVFHLSGPLKNSKLYNNVIYLSPEKESIKVIYHKKWGAYPDSTFYFNNIFYLASEKVIYDYGESTNNVFDYNVFYGSHPDNEPDDPHKLISDPKFINPGNAGVGIQSVKGYQLQKNSPCIDTGKEIPNNGGLDFWGNPLYNNFPDRGAHEQ